jgi:hypothetical protein
VDVSARHSSHAYAGTPQQLQLENTPRGPLLFVVSELALA